ncbi:hypothetical protein ACRAWD_20970 [Caulobacter segnis]
MAAGPLPIFRSTPCLPRPPHISSRCPSPPTTCGSRNSDPQPARPGDRRGPGQLVDRRSRRRRPCGGARDPAVVTTAWWW